MNTPTTALNAEFLARLRTFVRRRVRSEHDAEDIVQDVLARFVQHDRSIASDSIYAWLFTVARRAIVDHSRSRAVRAAHAAALVEPIAEADADNASAGADLARCMEPMLETLSSDDRVLLQRVDMVGESQTEIARELGMSISGMKSRVQRARRRLLAALQECCEIERDRLGQPADYQQRRDRPCHCDKCE